MTSGKRLLYVNRRAPYGTVQALEALEAVLMGAAFEQSVTVLFLDDGVYQLKRGQDPGAFGMKDFSPTFRALEDYEVERLVVERESLERRGLEPHDLLVPVEVMGTDAVSRLMEEHDVVFSF